MSKIGILAKSAQGVLKDYSPTILTGLSVSGLLATVVLAVKATPEASRRIQKLTDDMEDEYQAGGPEPLLIKNLDILKINWDLYIPAAIVGATTTLCILSANSIHTRRNAALISLYTLTERAYGEYKEKVVHTLGENKEARIRDAVAQDKVTAAGPSTVVIGVGNVPCFDTFTGRYFESTVETIRKAENDINRQCINDMYASQNDFYRLIGLPSVKVGDDVGWTTENVLEVQFSAVLDDGKPVMALDYRKAPKTGFHRVWG